MGAQVRSLNGAIASAYGLHREFLSAPKRALNCASLNGNTYVRSWRLIIVRGAAIFGLGRVYWSEGDLIKAGRQAGLAIQLNPSFAEAQLDRAFNLGLLFDAAALCPTSNKISSLTYD